MLIKNSEMSLLMTFKVDSDGDERLDPKHTILSLTLTT